MTTATSPARLAELVRARAASHPDLDVLTFVHVAADGALRDEVRTYAQLWERGCRLANVFRDRGLRTGDRIALLMHNHPEFVETMIAASIVGAVFVPIDPRTEGRALAHLLRFAECRAAVVADDALGNLLDVRRDVPGCERVLVLDGGSGIAGRAAGTTDLAAAMRAAASDCALTEVEPDSPMELLFTSGTTGDPKAIAVRHARFINSGAAATLFGFRPGDRPYTGLPFTHANAQFVTLSAALCMGLRGVVSRKFTKSRLWDITRRYGCTVFNLLGGMTVELYGEPPRPNDADNPVRFVISAGMPAAIWDDFRRRFGVEILEMYGAAEGGLTINPPGEGPVGSVGKPPKGIDVAVLDDEGNACAPGMPGEICFRLAEGGTPPLSYEKNADASARKTAGGWLHMGDVGHLDANGWLFFHHRAGDSLRRNGEFIDARLVEASVASCEHVSDAFVYGVARLEVPGEQDVVAAVVPRDAARFDAAAVFRHCRGSLRPNFVPKYLQVLEAIPKTASQKPLARVLLRSFAADAANVWVERSARR